MRLIIRWRCGDTSRWDGQTHSTASLVCFYAFHWQIGKFSNRRMKTLATLSANGFEAVYTEVRDYGWSTRLFLSLSPDCNYTLRVFFLQTLPRLLKWTGRDSVCWCDAIKWNDSRNMKDRDLVNYDELQKCPQPHARHLSRRARRRSTAQCRIWGKNIGPIQCVWI